MDRFEHVYPPLSLTNNALARWQAWSIHYGTEIPGPLMRLMRNYGGIVAASELHLSPQPSTTVADEIRQLLRTMSSAPEGADLEFRQSGPDGLVLLPAEQRIERIIRRLVISQMPDRNGPVGDTPVHLPRFLQNDINASLVDLLPMDDPRWQEINIDQNWRCEVRDLIQIAMLTHVVPGEPFYGYDALAVLTVWACGWPVIGLAPIPGQDKASKFVLACAAEGR